MKISLSLYSMALKRDRNLKEALQAHEKDIK
jgi:hypothetical protein